MQLLLEDAWAPHLVASRWHLHSAAASSLPQLGQREPLPRVCPAGHPAEDLARKVRRLWPERTGLLACIGIYLGENGWLSG